jgi:hypothetical protein
MVAVLSNQVGSTRLKQICISKFDNTRRGPLMPAAIHSIAAFVEVNIREIERLAFCYPDLCCRTCKVLLHLALKNQKGIEADRYLPEKRTISNRDKSVQRKHRFTALHVDSHVICNF